MPGEIYTVVASAARYWFIFLGLLIVWRSYSWLRKDRRAQKKRVKRLPDAGYVGELVVLAGSASLPVGSVLPLPREGTLGSLRGCDVVVPVEGVHPKHVAFAFHNGKGLMVEPYFRGDVAVDGQQADSRRQTLWMYHGSRLMMGDAVLRMRLFVGVDAPAPLTARPYAQEAPQDAGVYHQRALDWQTGRFAPIDMPEASYPYEEEDPQPDAFDPDDAFEGGQGY